MFPYTKEDFELMSFGLTWWHCGPRWPEAGIFRCWSGFFWIRNDDYTLLDECHQRQNGPWGFSVFLHQYDWYHPFKSGPNFTFRISINLSFQILTKIHHQYLEQASAYKIEETSASKSWQKCSFKRSTKFQLTNPQNLDQKISSKSCQLKNIIKTSASYREIILLESLMKFQLKNLDIASAFSCCVLSLELTNIAFVTLSTFTALCPKSCHQARAWSARAWRACALSALGLLLADSALTVGRGKTFWRVGQVFFFTKTAITRERKVKKLSPTWERNRLSKG